MDNKGKLIFLNEVILLIKFVFKNKDYKVLHRRSDKDSMF